MPIRPSQLDQKLVQSFRDAVKGRGDGRVSEADIKDLIAPRFKDAGRLTETEKATLEWAVEEFKLTDSAKKVLSDEITALAGGEVFAWQRNVGGAVAVRTSNQLMRNELDKKAADAFSENTTALSGEWGLDALFWHPTAGNSGTHLSELTGDDAVRHLKFLAAVNDNPSLLTDFSPDTHSIYNVYHSGDEEEFGAILVDKVTGEATGIEPFNIVDLTYVMDRAQFEDIFGEVKDDNGVRADDSEWEDYAYEAYMILHGDDPRPVELNFFGKEAEERRDGPLRDAARPIWEGLRDGGGARRAFYNDGALAKVGNLDDRLQSLADDVHQLDYRDKEKHDPADPHGMEPAAFTTVQPFSALDADGRASILASLQKGNPQITEAQLDNVFRNMGDAGDLRFAVIDTDMQITDRQTDVTTEFTARAFLVVNEKEGDFMTVYDRPKITGE